MSGCLQVKRAYASFQCSVCGMRLVCGIHQLPALEPSPPQELATLQILLLYSTPFKEAFGQALLAFYPHIGCELCGRLLLTAAVGSAGGLLPQNALGRPLRPQLLGPALACPDCAPLLTRTCCSPGQAAPRDQGAGPADGAGLPPRGGLLAVFLG